MFRRYPATLLLVAGCIGYTLLAAMLKWTPAEAGSFTRVEIWKGEYWRFFTSMFLHHTEFWAHLVMNALSLFVLGRIMEKICGWRIYLICVVGAALAGFAASLLLGGRLDTWHMGISGAIAGLMGLLLAIEWAVSRSVGQFIRSRNTILILLFLGLSIPTALIVESMYDHVTVDHAGHGGGFAFGLLAGLAYYSRRGRRPLAGAVAALLIGLLPLWVAAHPTWDARYLVWAGNRAYRENDIEAAVDYWERGLERMPADPSSAYAEMFQRAFVMLAQLKLEEGDRDRARELVARAEAMLHPMPAESAKRVGAAWLDYANAAREAGLRGEALDAYEIAARVLGGRASQEWLASLNVLGMLMETHGWRLEENPNAQLRRLNTAVVRAHKAVGVYAAEIPEEARREADARLGAIADALALDLAVIEGADEDDLKTTQGNLAELFRLLAENGLVDARRAGFRYRSAFWYWRATRGDPEQYEWVQKRFGAALSEAHEVADVTTQRAAEEWFVARGLPVPPPDLDGPDDGG